MPKPYEGDSNETCPHMGGKLCRKVCPTCRMYRQFFRDTPDGVRQPFYECNFVMSTSAVIEGNIIAAALDKRLVGVQAATEALRNRVADANAIGQRLASAQIEIARGSIDGPANGTRLIEG